MILHETRNSINILTPMSEEDKTNEHNYRIFVRRPET